MLFPSLDETLHFDKLIIHLPLKFKILKTLYNNINVIFECHVIQQIKTTMKIQWRCVQIRLTLLSYASDYGYQF